MGYKGLPTGIELVEQLKKVDDEEADNKGGFDRAVRVTTGLCLLITQCRDHRRMYVCSVILCRGPACCVILCRDPACSDILCRS